MSERDIRRAILNYQRANNLPDWVMCNILCIDEPEWNKFIHTGSASLSTFQKIMFITETNVVLPD